MQFQKFDSQYILRLETDDEIISTIQQFCRQQSIQAGWVNGIGAVCRATIGYFDRPTGTYLQTELNGDYELIGLMGNISILDGEPYPHLHATFSDRNCQMYGGHLISGTISATGEIIIRGLEGILDRQIVPELGLKLLKLQSP